MPDARLKFTVYAGMLLQLLWAGSALSATLAITRLPPLPQAVSNNAVAVVKQNDRQVLVSLLGLGTGKSWRDTHARVFTLSETDSRWQSRADVPGGPGRLAGTAIGLPGAVLVFGGYSVAADGSEESLNTVHRLELPGWRYRDLATMPVAVDDAVSFAYQDRYVYLVSGWHNHGNVNLVQVYDSHEDRWFQATPFPGVPVFGHAGGRSGQHIVICDGVEVRIFATDRRRFQSTDACFIGTIDLQDPARIDWQLLPSHPGRARYRMAASGSSREALILFAGGSERPYNFDGIGYDGEAAEPSAEVFAYDLELHRWRVLGELPVGSMDHRGLLETDAGWVIVGGMRNAQAVTAEVLRFQLPAAPH